MIDPEQRQSADAACVSVGVLRARAGEWVLAPVRQQSLALELDCAMRPATTTMASICTRDSRRVFQLPGEKQFASFMLPDVLLERAAQDAVGGQVCDVDVGDYVNDATLHGLLNLLWTEHRTGSPTGMLYRDSLGAALAAYLLRHHSSGVFPGALRRGGLGQSALRRCLEYVEASLDQTLRLVELARESGVSVSHFSRAFRESVGEAPYQYVQRRRIERAKSLMRDRRLSLTEVALGSGFADQHHLSRVFRRVAGLRPSSYRRSL